MNKKPQSSRNNQKKQLTNGKSKQGRNTVQQNILQTLRGQIDFLAIFTTAEIQFLFQNYDLIVFDRGMVLVKQNQVIDFVGVILNGGAIAQKSKIKYKKNSLLGNSVSLFGLDGHKHPQTIAAQSQGILFSVRIETLISPSKNELENIIKKKIINFIAQQTLFQLKEEKYFSFSIQSQFQPVDEKVSLKFQQSCKQYSSMLQSLGDQKEKQRFLEQFPLFCVKQKTLIASRHSKPYFLLLLKGQIMIKYGIGLKKQSKTLQANQIYNFQGFIFDHNQFSNLYCSSNEAVFMIVDKERLFNNFKLLSITGILKYLLDYSQKLNDYSLDIFLPKNQDISASKNQEIWSPFKKSFQIQQIPSKISSKTTQSKATNNKKKDSINAFQTLYQTYSNQSKNKLKSKETLITQNYGTVTGKQRLPTSNVLRTQYSTDEKSQGVINGQKIKKLENDLLALKQQNNSLILNIKKLKLQNLESQSKLNMIEVLRQIKNSKGLKQMESFMRNSSVKGQNKTVTLKEAFSSHLKNKKLQLLVAKCAYKWLSITRDNKSKRQNQSSASFVSKSFQGVQS